MRRQPVQEGLHGLQHDKSFGRAAPDRAALPARGPSRGAGWTASAARSSGGRQSRRCIHSFCSTSPSSAHPHAVAGHVSAHRVGGRWPVAALIRRSVGHGAACSPRAPAGYQRRHPAVALGSAGGETRHPAAVGCLAPGPGRSARCFSQRAARRDPAPPTRHAGCSNCDTGKPGAPGGRQDARGASAYSCGAFSVTGSRRGRRFVQRRH